MSTQKKKVYIAGAISGENKAKCIAKFAAAQKEVEAAGYEAINPITVVNNWNTTWVAAMKKCIPALCQADALYLLPCGKKSKGATVEMNIAANLLMPVVTQLETLKSNHRWNS